MLPSSLELSYSGSCPEIRRSDQYSNLATLFCAALRLAVRSHCWSGRNARLFPRNVRPDSELSHLFSGWSAVLRRVIPSPTNRLDADCSEILPMTVRSLVLLLALLLEHNDLALSAMLDHRAGHRRAIN